MQIKKITLPILILFSFFLSFTAYADTVKKPFSIGLALGYAVEDFNVDPDQDNTFAGHLNLGYRLNDNLGIEFQFDYMKNFDVKNPFSEDSLDINTYILMLKYYPPIGELTRAYLGVGAGLMDVEVNYKNHEVQDVKNRSRACGKFSIGLERSLSDSWVLSGSASYVGGHDGLDKIHYFVWHGGLKYNF